MSYFMIGVGGTGAKLVHSLLHLAAAGFLPARERTLECRLVDSDQANGNIDECNQLLAIYRACQNIPLGDCDLFRTRATLVGPWTPVKNENVDTLEDFFQYTQKRNQELLDADLMELLYHPEERTTQIKQGFRGRPAIGAAILAERINFTDRSDMWHAFIERIRQAGADVPVLLAGSIFGGTGAAGVPTIFRLLQGELARQVANLRLGLILMLPYFTFDTVPNERVQADPHSFANATAEALRYYHERRFLDICHSMYTLGEEKLALLKIPSVGAATQRNEPLFLELVAALGAVRFLSGQAEGETGNAIQDHVLSILARQRADLIVWADLPLSGQQAAKFQQMILFAVAFRYIFSPRIAAEVTDDRVLQKSSDTLIKAHVVKHGISSMEVRRDLDAVNNYIERFLFWFLSISTAHGSGVDVQLVRLDVFSRVVEGERLLLTLREFREKEFNAGLFPAPHTSPNAREIQERSIGAGGYAGAQPSRTGHLIRALYESCKVN